MWTIIVNDLKALLAKIETEVANAWVFLKAYIQEAINEEEAALFPIIEQQATQLLQDEAKTQGLDIKGRVAMAEVEILADLAADGKVAAVTLVNAYIWTVAHKLGLKDGNQGNLTTGNQTSS